MRVEERYLHVQVETGLAWSEEVTWNGLYDGGNKEDYAEGGVLPHNLLYYAEERGRRYFVMCSGNNDNGQKYEECQWDLVGWRAESDKQSNV